MDTLEKLGKILELQGASFDIWFHSIESPHRTYREARYLAEGLAEEIGGVLKERTTAFKIVDRESNMDIYIGFDPEEVEDA